MEENKEQEIDLMEIIQTAWKERKKLIKWGFWGGVVGLVIAFSIPKEYNSSATMAPEGVSSKSGVSGLAAMVGLSSGVTSDGIGVMLYPEIVASTPFLLEFKDMEVKLEDEEPMLMKDYILEGQKGTWWGFLFSLPRAAIGGIMSIFKDEEEEGSFETSALLQEDYCLALSERITSSLDEKQGTFTISSTFQDPVLAKVVADSALIKLQRYMDNYQTARTRSNLESNMKMFEEAREKYYQADEAYSEAYDRNQNLSLKSASIKLDRLRDERNMAYQIYTQLAAQVETDRVKLQEIKPIATVIEPVKLAARASSPRKLLILIAYAFLGGLIPFGKIVLGIINKK